MTKISEKTHVKSIACVWHLIPFSFVDVFFWLFDTDDNVNIFPNELIMNIIRIPHLNKYCVARNIFRLCVSSFNVFVLFSYSRIENGHKLWRKTHHTKKNCTIWILSREFINYFLSDHPDTQSAAKISFLSHRTIFLFLFISSWILILPKYHIADTRNKNIRNKNCFQIYSYENYIFSNILQIF